MSDYDEDEIRVLSDEDLLIIQDQYRRQKMKENLIGPVISTTVHVILLVLCATFFVGEIVEKNETVEITPVQEEIPQEEPPPPPPPPEIPPPEPQEVISHDPQATSDAVPDAADLVGAIDDVSDEPPSTDDNAETDLVNDIKPSASSIVSSKMFGGRSSAGRAGALKSYGGSVAAQQALHKALRWLAKVQRPDGSWGDDARARDGFTGLALLVFLAHGETPKSKSFGKTVGSAIEYLSHSKLPAKGAKFDYHGYPHAIKTYALAEAYTMTGNYALVSPLEKFAEVLIKGQMENGGVVYDFKSADPVGRGADISIGGWTYQALKALDATGLDLEGLDLCVERAVVQLKDSAKKDFPYEPTRDRKNFGLMAVGTLCLQLFGGAQGFKETDRILDRFKKEANIDWAKPIGQSMYAWYYITFAMFQKGGSHWKTWNNKFQNELKVNQNPDGYWQYPGSFFGPGNGKDNLDNHIHGTVFACLMLTVYYRYLPSTSKGKATQKNAKKPSVNKQKDVGEEELNIF